MYPKLAPGIRRTTQPLATTPHLVHHVLSLGGSELWAHYGFATASNRVRTTFGVSDGLDRPGSGGGGPDPSTHAIIVQHNQERCDRPRPGDDGSTHSSGTTALHNSKRVAQTFVFESIPANGYIHMFETQSYMCEWVRMYVCVRT